MWQERLADYIRKFGCCGSFRFRLLNFFYRFSKYHSRSVEHNFVLSYFDTLPKLWRVRVLDVGAAHSLFIYELLKRGYTVYGADQRRYQERIRKDILYFDCDIEKLCSPPTFDFITCISVIEHAGRPEYGGKEDPMGDYNMIKKIACLIRRGGIFLLTCPTKEWTGKTENNKGLTTICRGYDYHDLENLTKEWFKIIRHEIRRGQHCLALTRKYE